MAAVAEFEIYMDEAREWRWRLRAGNHEIVASSEGYTRRSDAIRGAKDMARTVFAAMANLMGKEAEAIDAHKR